MVVFGGCAILGASTDRSSKSTDRSWYSGLSTDRSSKSTDRSWKGGLSTDRSSKSTDRSWYGGLSTDFPLCWGSKHSKLYALGTTSVSSSISFLSLFVIDANCSSL